MNTFTTETDVKYVKSQSFKSTAIVFIILSLLACSGFMIAWETFVFFEAIILISCGITLFHKNHNNHDYILKFEDNKLYITNRTTGQIHEILDASYDSFIINQSKKEEELDYCSFVTKNTVFAFGGVKNCKELKNYISENYRIKTSIYKNLQDDFIMIRHLYSDGCYDRHLFNGTLESIKKSRDILSKESDTEEKQLLLYCIDTLIEIINENNESKIFDFADTIHNIPEICLGKRNIYSFHEEILAFQNKYGKSYFSYFKKIKPNFKKVNRKNVLIYFSVDADEGFKHLHPIEYNILLGLGITALFFPIVVYIIYLLFVNPAPNELAPILGIAGAFLIGIGLFNIVAAWIHQYLGHFVTVICILVGSLITALSLFLLYN